MRVGQTLSAGSARGLAVVVTWFWRVLRRASVIRRSEGTPGLVDRGHVDAAAERNAEWHSVRVRPDDTAAAIRAVAARFGRGEGSTLEMCSSLHGNLHDLCSERLLAGDYLRLFTALESWEVATGTDRESAAETARTIARHLGRGA